MSFDSDMSRPSPRTGPSGPRLRTKLVIIGLTCLFAVAALECFFRMFVRVTDVKFAFWDPVTGPRTAPNQSGWYIKGGVLSAHYRINSQGWTHSDDYVTTKAPGARRVCVVGDSQVESLQVNTDQSFLAVAEKKMSSSQRPVQWYAFGNAGWGTNVEYEVIRHYALDYRPDVLVLLFVQNDPFDCSPYLVDVGHDHPVYYLDDAGGLVLVPAASDWSPPWKARMVFKSALGRYFLAQQELLERLRTQGPGRFGVGGLPLMAQDQLGTKSIVPGVDKLNEEQRREMTWKLIERLLKESRDRCVERGVVFAIAFRGWMPEIECARTGATFIPAPREQDPWCLTEARYSEMGRDVVAPMARRLDIPYLDLTDCLKAMVKRTGKPHTFEADHHYNAAAHEAVGMAMSDWVETLFRRPASTQPAN